MDVSATVRHGLEALFNPYAIGLLLLAVLFAWHDCYKRQRISRVGFWMVWGILLLLSTRMVFGVLVQPWQRPYPIVTSVDPAIHWVVVLGAGQIKGVEAPANHVLRATGIERLVEGVRLHRQLPDAQLLLSGGGDVDPKKTEAGRFCELAKWLGVSSNRIMLESKSTNTAEQAQLIGQWVGTSPFYLVTSSVHMRRAMALFKREGLNPIAAPSDYPDAEPMDWARDWAPTPFYFEKANRAWHEVMGWIWANMNRAT